MQTVLKKFYLIFPCTKNINCSLFPRGPEEAVLGRYNER
jgi:hypothetical protein